MNCFICFLIGVVIGLIIGILRGAQYERSKNDSKFAREAWNDLVCTYRKRGEDKCGDDTNG